MGIKGIDVSAHQPRNIDWAAVKAAGFRYAIIKATEGTTYISPAFTTQAREAAAAGLVVGVYHFFRPEADPVVQAQFFARVAGAYMGAGQLPPMLDTEVDGINVAARGAMFLDKLDDISGVDMWYSGRSFAATHLGTAAYQGRPGMLAEYGPALKPSAAFPTAAFWQFTDRAQVAGLSVDASEFFGSEAAFAALVARKAAPAPAPVPAPVVVHVPAVVGRPVEPAVPVSVAPITAAVPSNRMHSVLVWAGGSLSAIAVACGVGLPAVEAANPQITNPNSVAVGQRVIVPATPGTTAPAPHTAPKPAPAPHTTPKPAPKPAPAPRQKYTVQKSDSDGLAAICHRIGCDWRTVARLSGLKGPRYTVHPGDVLTLPAGVSAPKVATSHAQSGAAVWVVVRHDDTVSAIAARNHITLARALLLNPQLRADPSRIYPGQQVRVR